MAGMDSRDVIWRLTSSGHETRSDPARYWWDNRHRGDGDDDYCAIQYTLRGSVTLIHDGQHQQAERGQAILYAYNEVSTYGLRPSDTTPYEHCWVLLHGAGLRRHWDDLRRRFGWVIDDDDEDSVLAAIEHLRRSASPHRSNDQGTAARLVHDFVLRLYACQEQRQDTRRPVERAVERMLTNPVFPWSLKALAADAGCSREHLTRIFHRITGHSPADWLNRQRLLAAQHLLANTGLPIARVAEQAGFGSTHTMARRMRASSGCGPSTYRERSRAIDPAED